MTGYSRRVSLQFLIPPDTALKWRYSKETLKFVFVDENCCLCKCSTLLIVGSLKSVIFIALPFVFSRS